MKMTSMIKKILVGGGALVLASTVSLAQAQTETLDDLLKQVEAGRYAEAKENSQREARFKAEKAKQVDLLNKAKAERRRLEEAAASCRRRRCHSSASAADAKGGKC